MKTLKQNVINRVNDEIDIIPLNLQDHLILVDGRIQGMFHVNHKTARVFSITPPLSDWLESEGFKIEYTAEPFVLAQWYDSATVGCGEIIYRNKQ